MITMKMPDLTLAMIFVLGSFAIFLNCDLRSQLWISVLKHVKLGLKIPELYGNHTDSAALSSYLQPGIWMLLKYF